MPLHTIGTLLRATEELKTLRLRTRRLQELQTHYLRVVPEALANASRVRNYRKGTLYIAADNAAIAAKLRQITPSLLASIRKLEGQVTAIRIEVQVSALQRVHRSHKMTLTPEAIEEFAALSERVSDGDLKSALANLVHRHSDSKKL